MTFNNCTVARFQLNKLCNHVEKLRTYRFNIQYLDHTENMAPNAFAIAQHINILMKKLRNPGTQKQILDDLIPHNH